MKFNTAMPLVWNVTYLVAVIENEWATELVCTGMLPFMPQVGMMIECGDNVFRQVTTIYWNSLTSELSVKFEDDAKTELALMRTCGWVEF